ncbi:uncharacterized protein [Nicotiana sylvestris]|uniref:uncharacterized protein n=1 Tax=Nicotiana sylvestris TaxID=4096 RepID=UPI00388C79A7
MSRRGIELDPSKVKAIQELPPSKNKKEVMSFLGRLNYIRRFIAQSTIICEPIFKMLKKDAATKWTNDCQKAFGRIKEYLSTPLHDETGRKEQAIYCLSKKFTPYKARRQSKDKHWQIILENLVDGEYEPLKTYFPDEEVYFIGENIAESYDSWRIFFDGAANFKGVGIGAVLVSEIGQHYPHPDKNFIDPIPVKIYDQPTHYAHVEEEADEKPWFHDIKEYLTKGEYPKLANPTQKRTLQRLSNNFFRSGGILYRRTLDLGLLRSSDSCRGKNSLFENHRKQNLTMQNG